MFPLLSVSVSVNVMPVKVTFPLFSTVIVYLITSPVSVIPFELAYVTVAVLVASIKAVSYTHLTMPTNREV